MTSERYRRIMQILAQRQPDLTILAEDVYKPHNLSAMLRSCDAVGIGLVHAIDPTGGVPTFNETSAGADRWVEVRVHADFAEASAQVRDQGMQLLAAHFSDRAVDYRDVDYTRPTAVLFGNEKRGVSHQAAARVDGHVIIPMLGMVRSLNVSVATAVILFEAQRQRREAGMFERPRLSPEQINAQAFRWLFPREAAVREARGEPFPGVLEDGTYEG
ncbi:MAG: tRNA (guanosine(18)-2'-O)-methyltransferase TrmH [Trueperaceae bacterium]